MLRPRKFRCGLGPTGIAEAQVYIDFSNCKGEAMATSDVTVRESIDWSAEIWSGIIAGAVFMMLEM